MQFELDLLENSYDYLNETLKYYKDLGYIETHDPDRDDLEDKKRWKTTYILLVQAVELLIKEKLNRMNKQLIFEDIDISNNDNSKVIGYSKSIDRLSNLKPGILNEEEKQFLKSCGNIRNQCIHYKVKLNSIEIKIKYCKLFELYNRLHTKFFGKKYQNEDYKIIIQNILSNAKDFHVYRGNEYSSSDLKFVKKELERAQEYRYCISKNVAYERIKYGDEQKLYFKFYGKEINLESSCRYCGDCLATIGEIHAEGCDCELCPKCGNQRITCDCFKCYYTKEDLERKNIKEIISI